MGNENIHKPRNWESENRTLFENIAKQKLFGRKKTTPLTTEMPSVLDEQIKKAGTSQSGVKLALSRDALQELRAKSNAEYNKIVDTASLKAGAMGEDVMKQFRTTALQQAKASTLAQANSSPQAVLSLLK